jgi:large subunit ribosomal protein L15
MKLSFLKPAEGSVKDNRRLGRGHGSGMGSTSTRGNNGAKSRSGYSQKKGFEGGQMPLQRRVPKFGFKNFNRVEYKAINLDAIQLLVDKTNLKVIDLGVLIANGLTSKSDLVKVLGRGELSTAVEIRVNAFSTSAIEAIEKAGGQAIVESRHLISPAEATLKSAKPRVGKKLTNSSNVSEVVVDLSSSISPSFIVEIPVVVEVPVTVIEPITAPDYSTVKDVLSFSDLAAQESVKISKVDDLKLIEGIGPKIADLFISAGIDSFEKLAIATLEDMKSILETGGSRYTMHDPTSWPQQAGLARDGKMEELKELQDRLNAGKA